MKVVVTCEKADHPNLEIIEDNNPLQLMRLMATAITAGKRILMYNLDNAGVTLQEEFPADTSESGKAPGGRKADASA